MAAKISVLEGPVVREENPDEMKGFRHVGREPKSVCDFPLKMCKTRQ